jgi:hypothetical protein
VKEGRYGRASSPDAGIGGVQRKYPLRVQLGVTDDQKLLATGQCHPVRVHGGEIIVAAHVTPRLHPHRIHVGIVGCLNGMWSRPPRVGNTTA